jgi:alpha-N-arabinofuranosidase
MIARFLPALAAALLPIACNGDAPNAEPSPPGAGFGGASATLTLDLRKTGAAVSPTLYGLMTEEINHSYDGGLYAELIQNRIFKDDSNAPVHWSLVQDAWGGGSMELDQTQPINDALTTCLKLAVVNSGQRVGIANDGYWGISVKPATTYKVSYYAKKSGAASGPLTVSIESNDGATVYAQAQTPSPTSQWAKYTATLRTTKNVQPSTGRFVISTGTRGIYWFNLVSLFPPTWHDRPNGNRPDIMQLLSDMKPAFLRLPGGNFLEGERIAMRFPWKQTLGDLSLRPGHPGCWGYRASDGMGLLEYLEWCEDLNIPPVLAVYAGYSFKEHVDAGAALQPFVDDALDEIEYVTGDATTKWGAERVKEGHPAPFPLTYVEIGNEDGADKSHSYQGRFTQFYDAIKAKYPNLKCIDTCGPKYWDHFVAKGERTPDLIDEHFYYHTALEMEANADHYDTYDRNGPKIFVGEWATREGSPTGNLNAALADAAWMTGMERNSDVVIMASYAPLFVNVNPGGREWAPNLIGYDALNSYGSPSYYAQKMFSTYLGESVVSAKSENIPTQTWQPPASKAKLGEPPSPPPAPKQVPTLFFVATRDSKKGTIYLKVVNTAATPQAVQINLSGAANIAHEGTAITLASSKSDDTNSITDPARIVPVTSKATGLGNTFTRTFAPYSVNLLLMEAQ